MAVEESQKEKHGKVIRKAGLMSLMTMTSRVFGLVRDVLMASLMGTGMMADAFRVASLIPNTMRRLLGEGAMTAAFIPTFAEVEKGGDKKKLWMFVSTFFCTFTTILLIVSALGVAFSPMIVDLFTSGEEGFASVAGKMELTIELNRIIFPYIGLISMAAIIMAVLNSLESFAPSAFTPVLFNIALIVCGWAFASTFMSPAHGFAIGFLVGGLAQVLFQVPFLKKYGVKFSFKVSFTDPYVKRVFKLMVPGLFAVGITQINILIATRILTGLAEGSTAGVYFANRLTELTQGIFAISVATVILPMMSRQAKANDIDGMRNTLSFATRIISFIIIPATVGLVVLRKPIVSILFERGQFDASSIELTAGPLMFFSIGLIFFSMIKIMVPAFYAMEKMKIPVLVSLADMAVNITLAFILSRFMGNSGVALAVTCGAAVNLALLLFIFTRKYGGLEVKSILSSLGKIVMAAAVMGASCYFLSGYLGLDMMPNGIIKTVMTIGVIAVGMAVFAGTSFTLRVKEVKELLGIMKGKVKKS